MSRRELYDRATIVGEEEVLYNPNEGIPDHLRGDQQPETLVNNDGEETQQQAAERKRQEEKELIMDRILDEERAQEDADEKVRALKARLAQVKKRREEAKKLNQASANSGKMDVER